MDFNIWNKPVLENILGIAEVSIRANKASFIHRIRNLFVYCFQISTDSFHHVLQNRRNNMKSFARRSICSSCKYKKVLFTIWYRYNPLCSDELHHGIYKRKIRCKYRVLWLESQTRDIGCARFNAVSDNFLRQGIILITTHLKRGNMQLLFRIVICFSWQPRTLWRIIRMLFCSLFSLHFHFDKPLNC